MSCFKKSEFGFYRKDLSLEAISKWRATGGLCI
jgi:hypothetical protein